MRTKPTLLPCGHFVTSDMPCSICADRAAVAARTAAAAPTPAVSGLDPTRAPRGDAPRGAVETTGSAATSWVVTEPTLLDGVPDDVYHGARVVTPGPQTSQSALKLLTPPSTPREFQWQLTTAQKPRRAFDVGRAAHTLVLGVGEPFTPCPQHLLSADGRMSTKAAKDWADAERASGRVPLRRDDYDAVQAMAAAILEHPRAAELVTDPDRRPEVSAFAEIVNGLWLRSRFDLLGGDLVDFKTAADPHPDAWRRSAWEYGCHVQDVAYRRVWSLITGQPAAPMTFVVVGKEPPHLVSICTLDDSFEGFGNAQLDAAIATYLEQSEKHGPPTGEGVMWDGLPAETAVLSPPRAAYWDAEGVSYEPEF